jgi:hypothetical protein
VGIGDVGTVLEGVRLEGEAKSDRRLHLERAKEGFAVCLKSLLQVVKGARGQ